MKRAAIFHGTDGDPNSLWLPSLKKILEDNHYQVYAPLLPENHTPNRQTYDKFLKDSEWNFRDNILVGHSSGATTVLNLLSSQWMPKVRAAVLVGTFLNERLLGSASWYEPGQFDNLFLPDYDLNLLKERADKFYFIHGDNDPYCDVEDAKKLCRQLNGEFIIIPNGGHLAASSGITEIPEISEALKHDNLL